MGLIISATLTPVADALGEGVPSSGTCDMERLGFAPLSSYLHPTEASLNVLLFVPLGLAVGMLPRGRPAAWLTLVVLLLPTVVEELQVVLPALGRVCQAADIIDNTTGAAIGLVMGHILGSASTALRLPGLDPPTR
jgi:glycopeptide antibiotics resistance protein